METTPDPTAEQRLAEQRLEEALRRTLGALPEASPVQRAFLYKRAGDVCVGLDERRKALPWYGRAVDQHLQLGDPEQAALLCRLIIHVQPEAVRARGTLTWIALGAGDDNEAARQLEAYVAAARRAGQEALCVRQLETMFGVTGSHALRRRVLAGLEAMGEMERTRVLAAAMDRPGVPQGERWERILAATTGTPMPPSAAQPG